MVQICINSASAVQLVKSVALWSLGAQGRVPGSVLSSAASGVGPIELGWEACEGSGLCLSATECDWSAYFTWSISGEHEERSPVIF